ncbi:MAG: hypothetical protein H7Z14_00665, partial [Anaerolineae bacterium]|nr:hypothetical protein [Phycisphaerae bacterium]
AKEAVTKYEVVEKIGAVSSQFAAKSSQSTLTANREPHTANSFSLVRLSPKTGRTHQLRVHLSAIGYPIVGDTMYGGRPLIHGDFRFERQALHAFQITFVHPATLNTMTLEAPLPPDMKRLLEIVRGDSGAR